MATLSGIPEAGGKSAAADGRLEAHEATIGETARHFLFHRRRTIAYILLERRRKGIPHA